MYENDPRMLFNQPLSGLVGIMSSVVLITQLFASFFLTTFFFYVFEIIIYISMLLVLSSGVRHKKPGNIMAYCLSLLIYIFWTSLGVMIFIWYVSIEAGLACGTPTTTPAPKKPTGQANEDVQPTGPPGLCNSHMSGQYVALLVCCVTFASISLLACAYQIRLCFLLHKILRNERRNQNMAVVTYQNRFGLNAPPRYTVSSPAPPPPPSSLATGTNLPDKPPCYAEALSSPTQPSPVQTLPTQLSPVQTLPTQPTPAQSTPAQPTPAIQLQPEVLMQDLIGNDHQQTVPSAQFADPFDVDLNRSNPTSNVTSQGEEHFETIILDPQTPVQSPITSTHEPLNSSNQPDNHVNVVQVDLLN